MYREWKKIEFPKEYYIYCIGYVALNVNDNIIECSIAVGRDTASLDNRFPG
jgi:hypothetical protein